MSAMTFDSSPIPGAHVPRDRAPFAGAGLWGRESNPGHEIVYVQRMLIKGGGGGE